LQTYPELSSIHLDSFSVLFATNLTQFEHLRLYMCWNTAKGHVALSLDLNNAINKQNKIKRWLIKKKN